MEKIKGKHVLVVGSGPSLKKYWDKIENFIKENNAITFGCNNIMGFLVPDYHFWGSARIWEKHKNKISNKTTIITSKYFSKKIIRKHWKGSYKTFNNIERRWKFNSDIRGTKENERCQVCYRGGKMYACIRDIASWAIFYAYIKRASKISVVGNDGYTLYSKKDLESKKYAQHCYGKGLTDGFTYQYCRKKDWDKYKTLRLLYKYGKKKYGFGFEIITPTLYQDFYNPIIFNIKKDSAWQRWKEPEEKEFKNLYFDVLKNRKNSNN